jgi:hypothetical protein
MATLDFRQKFIADALSICRKNEYKLTDWEKKFITDMENLCQNGNKLTQRQYNTLMEIKERVR